MRITIFDTTLRDGSQSRNISFSVRDKIEIAKALDDFGVDYIELGWPGSNENDMQTFLEASKLRLKNAKMVAFGSTRRKGIKAEEDSNLNAILESKAKVACIFGKTWLHHVEMQLKVTPKENLEAIEDSIRFLKGKGFDVFYDLEHFFDGFKHDKKYALECLRVAANAGASCLVLCDTNGGCLPDEVRKIVSEVNEFMKKNKIKTELGIHMHNDSGFATANTFEAVKLGVAQLQLTVNGFGERSGNADLCLLIPALILKEKMKLPKIKLGTLTELSRLVYTLANTKPNPAQPYVGKNAFSHKGGIHVDAMVKGATYEHIKPELVGNRSDIVLSELSGKANIVATAKKFGYKVDKNNPQVMDMLKEIEKLESKGYDLGNLPAEQLLLVEKFFGKNKEFFKIETWKVMSEQRNCEFSESVITGIVDGKERQVVAPVKGGPVDAIYSALIKLIAANYKQIETVKLINYKVMIAQDQGAESSVRVYIEFKDGSEEWGTVGVSTNILEASLEAIEKGFRYFLLRNC